jgi:hypothetical protein
MHDDEKRKLVFEHAHLTAAHAAGNDDVKNRLQEIEDKLQLSAPQIATLAVDAYLKDYF